MFNGESPRKKRKQELERRLAQIQLPAYLKHKVRRSLEKNESDALRRTRLISQKGRHTVKVGSYEIVKVLGKLHNLTIIHSAQDKAGRSRDLDTDNFIGKGSFGVVRLVKDKGMKRPELWKKSVPQTPSGVGSRKASMITLARDFSRRRRQNLPSNREVYAMKVIRKADMLRNSQEGHLRAERNFLVAAEGSKWVIPLITAFQDDKHLYLVMDFCIGGDFLGLLIRKNILSEQITKWYMAEMVLCVEEAHRMKWIHRDVKPDNFLIGADGHLKISDFGLAFDGL